MFIFATNVIITALTRVDLKADAKIRIEKLLITSKAHLHSWLPIIELSKSIHTHDQAKQLDEYPEELETLDDFCLANIIADERIKRWGTTPDEKIPIGLFAVCFILGKPPDFEKVVYSTRRRVRGLASDDAFRVEIEKQVRSTLLVKRRQAQLKSIISDSMRNPLMVKDSILYQLEFEIKPL